MSTEQAGDGTALRCYQCSIVIALAPELADGLDVAIASSAVAAFLRFLAPPSPADLRLGAMAGSAAPAGGEMQQSRLSRYLGPRY